MPESDHREFMRRFLEAEHALRAFLLAATGSADAAEDLLQATAGTLWEKWDQYDAARPFGPWALGVARLEMLNWRKRSARSRVILSSEAVERLSESAAEHAPEIALRHRFLLECLDALAGEGRGLLEMKYRDGLKIAQIAQRIGKSVAAVEMMLVRVRRILRDCVERKAARGLGETQ